MRTQKALTLLFLLATLVHSAIAQVVVITEYASVCSAVYTSGSRSVTVVQSIVTVQPQLSSDAAINGGAPFLLEVQPIAKLSQRLSAELPISWLTIWGRITTDISHAGQYHINAKNEIVDSTDAIVSINKSAGYDTVATSNTTQSISTTFSSQNNSLVWKNAGFDVQNALFYLVPDSITGKPLTVVAVFSRSSISTVPPTWQLVRLIPTIISSTGQLPSTPPLLPSVLSTKIEPGSTIMGSVTGSSGSTLISQAITTVSPVLATSKSKSAATELSSFPGAGTSIFSSVSESGIDSPSTWYQFSHEETSNTATGVSVHSSLPIYSVLASPIGPYNPGNPSLTHLPPEVSSYESSSYIATPPISSNAPITVSASSVSSITSSDLSRTSSSGSGTNNDLFSLASVFSSTSVTSVYSSSSYLPPLSVGSFFTSTEMLSADVSSKITISSVTAATSKTVTTSSIYLSEFTSASVIPLSASYITSSDASSVNFGPTTLSSSTGPKASSTASSASNIATTMTSKYSSTFNSGLATFSSDSSISSTISINTVAPTACPGLSGQTFSSNGQQYIIGCGDDTTGSPVYLGQATTSWEDCLNDCFGAENCTGFTYSGSNSGNGSGACLMTTDSPLDFVAGVGNSYIAAINIKYLTTSVSSSSITLSSTFSSSSASTPTLPFVASLSASSTTSTTLSPSSTVLLYLPISSLVLLSSSTSPSIPSPSSSTTSSTSSGPYVLASPIACSFGDPQYFIEDDSFCEVDLPFQMSIYSAMSSTTWPSTNGFISIGEGSIAFEPQHLPSDQLPPNTVCPYWDDLYKSEGTDQGIFYQIDPTNTSVTFEYYIGHAGYETADPIHFTVVYDSLTPGVFVYHYYGTGSGPTANGILASVGAQGVDPIGTQGGTQYSLDSAAIMPGLIVTCDTNINTCVKTT